MAEPIHKPGSFDMSAILKKSREQNAQKNAQRAARIEARNRQVPQSNPTQDINEATDIQSAKSGDYVQTEDGGAIVIDHEEELRKIRESNKTAKALDNLLDESKLVIDANEYNPQYRNGFNPRDEWLRQHPADSQTKNVIGMMEGFGQLTYGLNGLVRVGTPEAIAVAEALENLRTGKVILPTPEEYEAQKKAAEERKRIRRAKLSGQPQPKQQSQQQPQQKKEPVSPVRRVPNRSPQPEERKMAKMPEHIVIQEGVFEQWLR